MRITKMITKGELRPVSLKQFLPTSTVRNALGPNKENLYVDTGE